MIGNFYLLQLHTIITYDDKVEYYKYAKSNKKYTCFQGAHGKHGKSLLTSQGAHQAGAHPGFRSIKRLGVFLLPPGLDASPSQGYPQQ